MKQYLNLMTFGIRPKKGAPSHLCIEGVTREAARVRGATKHIPGLPRVYLIEGEDPVVVGQEAILQAGSAFDFRGRRLRKNGAALVAAVVSYPVSMQDIGAYPEKEEQLHKWVDQTVAWARQLWGRQIKSVVLHTDEEYPHLHLFVVPELLPSNRLDVWAIHPGIAARDAAQRAGHSTSAQTRAYIAAMKDLQSEFHGAVSANFGHARKGNGRKRMDRTQVMIDRRQRQRELDLNVREASLISEDTHDRQRLLKGEAEIAALRQALAAAEAHNQALASVVDRQRIEREALVDRIAQIEHVTRLREATIAQTDLDLANREQAIAEQQALIAREKIEIAHARDTLRSVRSYLASEATRLEAERQRPSAHAVASVMSPSKPDNDDAVVLRRVA
jgi:hypothetical protein